MKTFLIAIACGLALLGCEDKKPAPSPDPAPSAAPSTSPAPAVSSAPVATKPEAPPESISAQHVLVAYKGAKQAPKSVTRTKAEAQTRAGEVVKAAKGGTDFTSLVTQYSDDDTAKDRQGSLGKFTRDKMVKQFSDAAFALKVNEVSDVVETPFGFHVIKRNQ